MRVRHVRRALLAACCAAVVGCGPESNEDYFNRTATKGVEGPAQTYGSGAGAPQPGQGGYPSPAGEAAAEGTAPPAAEAAAPAPEAPPAPAPAAAPEAAPAPAAAPQP
jgi:hypothetical protein